MKHNDGFDHFSRMQHTSLHQGEKESEKLCYSIAAREDRSGERYCVEIEASMRQAGHRSFPIVIRNISLSGFVCDGLSHMVPGHRCFIKIARRESLGASVIWNDGWQIGAAFSRLLAPDFLYEINAEHGVNKD